jgi:putative endonuclease
MALHNLIGASGEDIATEYVQKQGYTVLERNFRCKLGEIDIIAKDGAQMVFVEVKTRTSSLFGTPLEAITRKKLLSLVKSAEYYLLTNKLGQNYRIDAVEIVMRKGQLNEVNQVKNITF